jgi:hypothetical protein
MLSDQPLEATRAYYERGDELGRLATGAGEVEFERLYQEIPQAEAGIAALERTGRVPPLHPGSFCGYEHRPGQLRSELPDARQISARSGCADPW